jgi:hypothetical protein
MTSLPSHLPRRRPFETPGSTNPRIYPESKLAPRPRPQRRQSLDAAASSRPYPRAARHGLLIQARSSGSRSTPRGAPCFQSMFTHSMCRSAWITVTTRWRADAWGVPMMQGRVRPQTKVPAEGLGRHARESDVREFYPGATMLDTHLNPHGTRADSGCVPEVAVRLWWGRGKAGWIPLAARHASHASPAR